MKKEKLREIIEIQKNQILNMELLSDFEKLNYLNNWVSAKEIKAFIIQKKQLSHTSSIMIECIISGMCQYNGFDFIKGKIKDSAKKIVINCFFIDTNNQRKH
jgi:hypothetical protein